MTTELNVQQEPTVIAAGPGTRLEQLHAMYPDAKAKADAAAAELKAITDAIKLELTQGPHGDASTLRYVLAEGSAYSAPALALTYSESWRVDARKLKAEDPETYVRYAKKSGSWSLRPVAKVGDDS